MQLNLRSFPSTFIKLFYFSFKIIVVALAYNFRTKIFTNELKLNKNCFLILQVS